MSDMKPPLNLPVALTTETLRIAIAAGAEARFPGLGGPAVVALFSIWGQFRQGRFNRYVESLIRRNADPSVLNDADDGPYGSASSKRVLVMQ
jgi:hypothetical protein